MKKITRLFLVLGFVLAFPVLKLHAQKSFEGTITMSMTMPIMGDEDPHPMIINIKGTKIETEMDMGAMGSTKIYSDGKKAYSVTAMGGRKLGYVADMAPDSSATKMVKDQLDPADLKPTGQKETIAGHPAEEYILSGVKMRGVMVDLSIWLASGFPKKIQESLYNSLKK